MLQGSHLANQLGLIGMLQGSHLANLLLTLVALCAL